MILIGCTVEQPRFKPTKKPESVMGAPSEPKVMMEVNDVYRIYLDPELYDKVVKAVHNKAGKILVGNVVVDYVNIKNHDEWDGPLPINAIKLYYPAMIDDKWYTELVLHKIVKAATDKRPELWMFIDKGDTKTEQMFASVDLPFNIVYSTDPNENNAQVPTKRPYAYWGTEDFPDKSQHKHYSSTFKTPSDLIWQFHKTRHPDYKPEGFTYQGREIRFGDPWYEFTGRRGYGTTIDHLINVHGYTMEQLQPYLHDQHLLNRIHGYAHTGQGTRTP